MSELKVVAVTAVPGTLAPAVARAYRSTGPAPAEAPAALARAAASPQLQRSLRELAAELASNASESGIADPAVASESDNTLVRLVNRLIAEAVEQRASDIHIETAEPPRAVTVRLRIDGELVRHLEVPASYRFALVARLKIMAELDISSTASRRTARSTSRASAARASNCAWSPCPLRAAWRTWCCACSAA